MGSRSRKRQGRRRLASEINVVPYIDVMLVLLIIFMVTAPLLTTGVNVDLPKAPAKVLDMAEDKPVVLTVTADGDYSLNVGPSPDEPLSSDRIVTIVGQVLAARPEAPVAVRGDGQGNYADVVRGMVMLQQAGAEKVGLITDNVDASDSGSR
ncbi:MAG: protein TolR [Xanthomonadales bacterium]|nr:protein TolR [Xanthomonadales bacterium]|tara:strand:- start:387 stop:842 length:456 start_codon:yes stop_codon:yes gene_type:complete